MSFLIFVSLSSVLVCFCSAQLCHDGMVKYTSDSKLACINGTWTAIGCQMEDGQQLAEGQTMVQEPFLIQCQKSKNDSMKLRAIGCFKNGRILAPSQTIETSDSFYTCVPKRDGVVSFQLSGCALPRKFDRKVPFGTTVQFESAIVKCIMTDSPKLEPVGCIYNNQTYMMNETIVDEQYWYVCEKSAENVAKMAMKGCINDRMPVNMGDIFYSKSIIYECKSDNDGIKAVIIGCLELTPLKNVVEHNIGDGWTEGDGSERITLQCTKNGPVIVN
jgi:hypothetical protein